MTENGTAGLPPDLVGQVVATEDSTPLQFDAAFRAPTRVDFTDASFFALVGPTGSGKSTVIDAMAFALYRSVPRWGRRGMVSLALAPTTSGATVAVRSALAGHGVPGGEDLLIVDGPLRGRQHLPRTLGYIKSHRSSYLPPELNALVATLEPGQRTPVSLMGTSWDRHSWYVRLPRTDGPPWAGVVRVECSADLPAADVVGLADLSQACLGRFASIRYKDPRAPKNLYPISGLERVLRRRLGDPRLLYRAPCQSPTQ